MTAAQPSGVTSAIIYTRVNWRNFANCRGHERELFYPISTTASTLQAKALCKDCPVKNNCLEEAFEQEDFNGIWGGLTGPERQKLRRDSRRSSESRPPAAAPAKHSPVAHIDETLAPEEILNWYLDVRHRLGPAAVRHLDNHYQAARHPNAPGRAQKLGWIETGLREIDQPAAIATA